MRYNFKKFKGVKMNILITGGAGYIGSHVLKQLLEGSKHDICVIDNLYSGKIEAIETLQKIRKFEFYKIALEDSTELARLFGARKFDAIIHFAAFIEVAESVEKPLKYYLNNTANTAKLAQFATKNGVKYFIFSSTAATYGEPKSGIVSEESEQKPINPYGASKLMSERIIKDACAASRIKDDKNGMKYGILRYFNVAGADGLIGQNYPNATHLIKVVCECICGKREQISIFGSDYASKDGTCERDYIHVLDLASAHLAVLEYLAKNDSEIFNVGYGKGFSVKEVIECARRVSGVDFKAVMSQRRQGDPAVLISNANKIRSKTSWKPAHESLEEIISSALAWEKKLK